MPDLIEPLSLNNMQARHFAEYVYITVAVSSQILEKIFVKIPIWTWKSFLISAWEDQIYPRPPHTSWSTMATDPWCSVGNIGDPGVISSRSLFDVWWLDRSIDWRLSCKDFRSKLDRHYDRPSGKKVMIQPRVVNLTDSMWPKNLNMTGNWQRRKLTF